MQSAWKKLALVLLVLALSCWEERSSYYRTLGDAERDGAISRGWIPDFLPRSSVNLREVHDLDTNEVWGAFDFDPRDKGWFEERLQGLGARRVGLEEVRVPPRARLWPRDLLTPGSPRPPTAYQAYSVQWRGPLTLVLAVGLEASKGYFYGPPQ